MVLMLEIFLTPCYMNQGSGLINNYDFYMITYSI